MNAKQDIARPSLSAVDRQSALRGLDTAVICAIALVAIGIAGVAFAAYFRDPESLWRFYYHDRNSHLSFGMDLGIAMRTLDPVWYLGELEKAKVWPPLHGMLLGLVMFVGGIDYRLAIVPSLVGWTVTVVVTALIARNLFKEQLPGIAAAVFAATLTATSPTFRLLGSDVMFEGLGAALSALALWSYQLARRARTDEGRWRTLAVILTALFFHKGNYWGLVVASLATAFVVEEFGAVRATLRETWRSLDVRGLAFKLVHHPLVYGSFCVCVAVIVLYRRGPTEILLLGRPLRLYPPENLVTVAYALLFLRLWLLWRDHRAALRSALGASGRVLFYWHVVPVAVSFLLPKRLSAFLWYVGPSNSLSGAFDPIGGLALYADAFANGFHAAQWIAVLVVVLAVLGSMAVRRMTAGAPAVFVFVLVCSLAVLIHPQHQGRFLATWIFSVWIAAGAGLGLLFQLAQGRGRRGVRVVAAAALLTLFCIVSSLPSWRAEAFKYAIRETAGPSDIDLVRPYLNELDGAREILIATTFGSSKLFNWLIHQRCGCKIKVGDPFINNMPSREETRQRMMDVVSQSSADRIVIIDAARGRYSFPRLGWNYDTMVGIVEAMERQSRFKRRAEYDLSSEGARATLWVR